MEGLTYLIELGIGLFRAALIGKEVLLADAGLEGDCFADEGLDFPLDAIPLHSLDWTNLYLDLQYKSFHWQLKPDWEVLHFKCCNAIKMKAAGIQLAIQCDDKTRSLLASFKCLLQSL